MVLQQSLIPQIFVTGPSIKFIRRRQKLLKTIKPTLKKKSCFPTQTKKQKSSVPKQPVNDRRVVQPDERIQEYITKLGRFIPQ